MKYISIFLVIILFLTCAKIKLKPENLDHNFSPNWEMYGGNPARTNFSNANISLPLELKWKYNASAAINKTILVIDGIVYFVSMDGRLHALDIRTGEKIGNKKIGVDATTIYHDDNLLLALRYGDETLFKYDLISAKYTWKIDAGDLASEPLIVKDDVIVTALYNHIDRYQLSDGVKIWQRKTTGQIRSSPAFYENTIVFGCDDGYLYAVNYLSGEILWKFKTDASISSTPAISDSIVYVGSSDKTFYAIHLKTGQLIWHFTTNGQILNPAAVADSLVVFGSNDARLYCLDRFTGKKIWKFQATSVISTHPVISRNLVFFGSMDHHYYAVDLRTGNEQWKYKTKGRVNAAPVIWGNYLIGASEDNVLYAFTTTDEMKP